MRLIAFISVATAIAGMTAAASASPTTKELARQVQQIGRSNRKLVETSTIGKSREGRPIHLIRLGAPGGRGESGPDERPALLIVAGVNGDYLFTSDIALGVAQALLADHSDELSETTVYIVPRLNPDAAAVHLENAGPNRSFSSTTTPDDADHDSRIDEDGPNDVNGDGVITMMRIKNPPAWLGAEYVIDTDEPRLMRAPKSEDGEVAEYAMLIESIDDDGDGLFAEDGPGGVELDKNFPHLWPEHKNGAGQYQLAEAESQAMARWMLDHPNINAVLVFGPHDTLVKIPTSGKMDVTGEAPVGIAKDDKPFYEKISEVFKEITKMKSASTADSAGSLHAWAYAQYGAPSFSTPVWVRPDQIEQDKKDGESDGDGESKSSSDDSDDAGEKGMTTADIQALVSEFQSADDAQRGALMSKFRSMSPDVRRRVRAVMQGQPDPDAKGGAKKSGKTDEEDTKWLKYSDEHRDGAGFIKWKEFEHPQLGAVEIGGFVPGFKIAPPIEELPRLIDEQSRFAVELMGKLPRVTIADPIVESVGAGVWRVRIEVVNSGYFPTMLSIAKTARRTNGVTMRLDLPSSAILAGEAQQITRGIDGSGGRASAEWVVAGKAGSTVNVIVRSPALGERHISVKLGR